MAPTRATQLHSLELRIAHRRFVSNFARIKSPLSKILTKTQDEELGPFHEHKLKALDSSKDKLISLPVLTLSEREGQFTLDADTCNHQGGCVLLQKHEVGKDRPIRGWSRTLTKREKNPNTTHPQFLLLFALPFPSPTTLS